MEVNMLRLNESAQKKKHEVKIGGFFEVCLPENPTTGFRWSIVNPDNKGCELLGERFEPGLQLTGQTGIHVWKFKMESEGATTVQLVYRRSWESKTTAARTASFQITGSK